MKKIEIVNRVHTALELLIEKSNYDKKIYDLTSEEFKDPPERPSRQIAQVKEVEVVSTLKPDYSKYTQPLKLFAIVFVAALLLSIINPIFTAILIFFSLFMFAPFVIYIVYQRYFVYPKEVQKDIERIKTTSWYFNQVKSEQVAAEAKQKEFDAIYADRMKIYQASYEEWKSEKESFEKRRDEEYTRLYQERATVIDSINSVCSCAGIPTAYRNINAVRYIYNTIASSNFTVVQAIEAYDRDRQLALDEQRVSELQRHNDLQEEYNSEMRYQSDLQEEANDIAEKHRREAAMLGAYNAYHNHKQTKMMKAEMRRKEQSRAAAKRRY